jgi:hypothetical protein
MARDHAEAANAVRAADAGFTYAQPGSFLLGCYHPQAIRGYATVDGSSELP